MVTLSACIAAVAPNRKAHRPPRRSLRRSRLNPLLRTRPNDVAPVISRQAACLRLVASLHPPNRIEEYTFSKILRPTGSLSLCSWNLFSMGRHRVDSHDRHW